MTQDDRIGKYWIWQEQLKVAIITVDIAVLCAQTLVDIITTCPKYPFKFPVTVPPVTRLAQLNWEKKIPGLLSGRRQARPPGQRYLTKCLAANKFWRVQLS